MRFAPTLALLLFALNGPAQSGLPGDATTLPEWMGTLVLGKRPQHSAKPAGKPLHTNAFIGTWSIRSKASRQYEYWGDEHRFVLRAMSAPDQVAHATLVDLAANVRLEVHWSEQRCYTTVEDLYLPQAGYSHDLWNDSVKTTGRTQEILGHRCEQQLGVDGNGDSTFYWRADVHPTLFADLKAWSRWLREGELEHLVAFADERAGSSLRVDWNTRKYGSSAGSLWFTAITPGRVPMPELRMAGAVISEERLAWINNASTGRLPEWMRAYVTALPPFDPPFQPTPAPVDRDLPDNRFIGTLAGQHRTRVIGAPGKDGRRDTTIEVATYRYWADARRAVLELDDPDDEGYIVYAVDLDQDVVMSAHNEGHSYVIPKLYIASLAEVGLAEFGPGLELDLTATGQTHTILGRPCDVYRTSDWPHFVLLPKEELANPTFDMKNWITKRIGGKFKELFAFAVAGRTMPMAAGGVELTQYAPGKAKPPVLDLSTYIVRDERPREAREARERARDIEVQDVPMVVEERGTGNYDMDVAVPMEGLAYDVVPDAPRGPMLSPYLTEVAARTTNRFIGTATLEYTRTYHGTTTRWTVSYASTPDSMVLIGHSSEYLPSVRTQAFVIDRLHGTERYHTLMADSSVTRFPRPLRAPEWSRSPEELADTLQPGTKDILGRACEQRVRRGPAQRTAWVDPATPSLFMDIFSARKTWQGIDHLVNGYHLISPTDGMPMAVEFTNDPNDRTTMRVLDIRPGPLDPALFRISKERWR